MKIKWRLVLWGIFNVQMISNFISVQIKLKIHGPPSVLCNHKDKWCGRLCLSWMQLCQLSTF